MLPLLVAKVARRALRGGDGDPRGTHTKTHRALAVFVVLCTFVAFVLSLLTLFSGNHNGFLQDGDVVQLNISRFGQTPVFSNLWNSSDSSNNNDDNDGGDGDDDDSWIGDIWGGIKNKTASTLDDWIHDAADSLTSALDLPDFYNVHLLNHCSGYYNPVNYTLDDVAAGRVGENITHCSSLSNHTHHQYLNFNLTEKVAAALSVLPGNVTLEDLHWPDEISDAETALKVVGHVVFVLYVLGTSVVGGAFLVNILGVIFAHRGIRFVGLALEVIAFFGLMLVSAIVTIVVKKAVHTMNKAGADFGVAATVGGLFLWMTWTAVILLGVALMASTFLYCAGRRKSRAVEKSYFR